MNIWIHKIKNVYHAILIVVVVLAQVRLNVLFVQNDHKKSQSLQFKKQIIEYNV